MSDTEILNWIERNNLGSVPGTDTAEWYVEAPDEDQWTLRTAVEYWARQETAK